MNLKMMILLILTLTIMSVSFSCVSAVDLDDSNSTTANVNDNSQFKINDENEDLLKNANDDSKLEAITPTVTITDSSHTGEVNNIDKGTKVSINVNANANFNYHYDTKMVYVYVNDNQINSVQLSRNGYDGNNYVGTFDYTFTNDGTYSLKAIMPAYPGYGESYNQATSNIITYVVGQGSGGTDPTPSTNGTNPVYNSTANLRIYDAGYPSNSTIYSVGDYRATLMYVLDKSGDGFSDEVLTVVITDSEGRSQSQRMSLNSQNTLGSLTITEDNVYTFQVTYTATLNGKEYTTTSNVLTYVTKDTSNITDPDNGTVPGDVSASLRIYDAGYPSNSTIYSVGDYRATLMYVLDKSGDGFSDEVLTVVITDSEGRSQSQRMSLNSQNTLGSLTITEDNVYTFYVTYTATLNGKEYSTTSNTLTYITKNTSNTTSPEDTNGTTPVDNVSASLRIYDAGYPSNSTVYSVGDYRATLMYVLDKSGDGFSDEVLTVVITDSEGRSQSQRMSLNSQNTLGSLTITEDNVYTFYVTYTATLNGKEYSTRSNVLTYVTKNTSNATENKTEDDDNGTEPVNPSQIQVIIRDSNYPNNSTVNVVENYTPVLEYYVVVPQGNLLTSEIVILCDGQGIATISKDDIVSNKFTKFTLNKILNETGSHVFSAQYKYYVFMGEMGDIDSNRITYVVTGGLNNETIPVEPINNTNGTIPGNDTTNTTNGTVPSGNESSNKTNETTPLDNQTEEVSILIKDLNSNNSVVNVDGEFVPEIEYYIVKPSGDFLTDEIIITLNGKAIQTIENPVNKQYTKITLNEKLNETGTYVLKAQYKYYIFMGLGEEIDANSITYIVNITNSTTPISNETKPENNTNQSSGNNTHEDDTNQSSENVTKDKLLSIINVNIVDSDGKMSGILIDANGKGISNAEINYVIDGISSYVKSDDSGKFRINGAFNKNIEFSFAGNDDYLASNNTLFIEKQIQSKLATQFNVTGGLTYTQYAIEYSSGERGQNFTVQLLDQNGNPLANKEILVGYNGKILNRTTDATGHASVQINLRDENRLTFAVTFLGDENYNATMTVYLITIVKKPVTMTASAKSFKASAKTKKYTVSLKTITGASANGKTYFAAGKKVTMKINGKTYSAKTNAKGQATFKITKLTKKGTYSAVINYAGDTTYKSVSKTVKISIK